MELSASALSRVGRFARCGLLPVIASLQLCACSNLYRYEAQSYIVQPGDTLYSIAWRYGLDQRQLASWNGISNPDMLYVGQRLALSGTGAVAASGVGGSGNSAAASSGQVAGTRAASPAPARPAASAAAPSWQWPVRGSLVARYGERGPLSTGIGISSSLGTDIVTAAPGRVVYAGTGLRDYGQLIIIEHEGNWLSAYGHNRRILVAEGDVVRAGQKVAEMGPGPDNRPRLHFEIRRNGDPVDPVALLPQ